MKLSVILPVYSETESVGKILERLASLLGEELHEVIVILSPFSSKETLDICDQLKEKYTFMKVYLQKDNPGVGKAFREGFACARGSHILMMDSDGEMDVETVPKMVARIKQLNCDMVLASRWMKGGGVVEYDRLKYILNRTYQYLFRGLYLTGLHDLTFGFKLMKARIAQGISWGSTYNEIGAETTLKPLKLKYKIGEVPTVWRKRKYGKSKTRFLWNFRYAAVAFSVLLRFKP
jgi:dolichol-phosphate mannosyltransferase